MGWGWGKTNVSCHRIAGGLMKLISQLLMANTIDLGCGLMHDIVAMSTNKRILHRRSDHVPVIDKTSPE